MIEISKHCSLISHNTNGFNSPNRKTQTNRMNINQDPSFGCIQEKHLNMDDRLHLKVKGSSKKIIQANEPEKQPGVAILVSDIIDFKTHQRR